MNPHDSTIRVSGESTVGSDEQTEQVASSIRQARRCLGAGSRSGGQESAAASASPLQDKSLFLNRVLEDYKASRRESPELTISQYVGQFRGLGRSIERSIFRLLEVQDYLDGHPELLEFVDEFEWPATGDTLQGFHVLEELGRGTLSRVYLCQQPEIGQRAVVLKVTRGGDYEASIMGRLDHPNIVPVYSIAADQQLHVTFICMPFRGRSTLQDLIDHAFSGGLPRRPDLLVEAATLWSRPGDQVLEGDSKPETSQLFGGSYVDRAVNLAVQLTAALAHAHQQGILHGDFKPSNVLLTPQGTPLLIDFNLAKDRRAAMGPPGGTLPYMAPEQLAGILSDASGEPPPYDVRCEVFSFGVVLFQLLTGHVPFSIGDGPDDPAATAAHLLDAQQSTLPQVRAANPFVNRGLEATVLRCLACRPSERPQSMDELSGLLRRQVSPLNRLRRWFGSHVRLTAALAAGVTLLLMAWTGSLALRPPYDMRQFNRGIERQRQHDYRAALSYFDRAAQANPQFRDAAFERARTSMLVGDLDAAMGGFERLARESADPASAAYLGYCFNMKQDSTAAIVWYERALSLGFETSGLHNNVGVSYQIARSQQSYSDGLALAEQHLQRALELDPASLIVRRNLVTLDLAKASADPSYVPQSALQHLQVMLDTDPADPTIWLDAAELYAVLAQRDNDPDWLDKGIDAIRSAVQHGGGPTAPELATESGFSAYRLHPEFAGLVESLRNAPVPTNRPTPPRFVDPVSLPSFGDSSR